jgi:hypothetical protein
MPMPFCCICGSLCTSFPANGIVNIEATVAGVIDADARCGGCANSTPNGPNGSFALVQQTPPCLLFLFPAAANFSSPPAALNPYYGQPGCLFNYEITWVQGCDSGFTLCFVAVFFQLWLVKGTDGTYALIAIDGDPCGAALFWKIYATIPNCNVLTSAVLSYQAYLPARPPCAGGVGSCEPCNWSAATVTLSPA